MDKGYKKGTITSNIEIASNIYELKVASSFNSPFYGEAGQFYMLRAWNGLDPFLARPLSISNIMDGEITFLYQLRGRGTERISKLKSGDSLELMGPLGSSFNTNLRGNVALISGGIGIAPLVFLAKSLKANIDFYCGFKDEVYYMDKIRKYSRAVYISTESGSVGYRGLITEIFNPALYDIAFSCGPVGMMKRIVKMCKGKIPVYISMENRMACGIGACLGCSIKTSEGMKRVCKEGAVFLGEEVFYCD